MLIVLCCVEWFRIPLSLSERRRKPNKKKRRREEKRREEKRREEKAVGL